MDPIQTVWDFKILGWWSARLGHRELKRRTAFENHVFLCLILDELQNNRSGAVPLLELRKTINRRLLTEFYYKGYRRRGYLFMIAQLHRWAAIELSRRPLLGIAKPFGIDDVYVCIRSKDNFGPDLNLRVTVDTSRPERPNTTELPNSDVRKEPNPDYKPPWAKDDEQDKQAADAPGSEDESDETIGDSFPGVPTDLTKFLPTTRPPDEHLH